MATCQAEEKGIDGDQALCDVQDRAFVILSEGASDPHSAWRNVALATVAASGAPRIRTLVLRSFDPVTRSLALHTDSRSGKFSELLANPRAALHAWNPATAEQLRVEGVVTVHQNDSVTAAAWQKLGFRTRDTYRVTQPPGFTVSSPEEPEHTLTDDQALTHFAVLALDVARLEYLLIAESGHRRAVFTWADGLAKGMWLVP